MKRKQALIFLVLLTLSVGCDHATKQIALKILEGSPTLSMAGDTLRFQLASNPGAFLSLGSQLPAWVREAIFLGLIPALLAIVCIGALHKGFASRGSVVGLALVAGGGLANWLDRVMNDGSVTDFMSLGIGPIRTGIFNFADVSILAGAALLYWSLRHRDDSEQQAA